MIFRISANARQNVLEQYRLWKIHYPSLNIGNAIRKLYQDIQVRGLYLASDTQLKIWVAKNYVVYRTKDAKWYFGGYYNKSKTSFTAQEALPCDKMADSAHNPSTPEHNNYHPSTPINNNLVRLGQIISETINNYLKDNLLIA